MLFSGDPISDQGKYKNVAQIVHIAVIVTCNISSTGRENKWNGTKFRYTW